MDALRKQATKLREQVARQQQVFLTLRIPIPLPLHRFLVLVNRRMSRSFCSLTFLQLISRPAVLKQFGGGGFGISDNVITDEAELQQYRRIEQLYISTRSSKVVEPLRAMVVGAQLEDARHLAQRYEKMRQEAETQMVSKRQGFEASPSSVLDEPVPPPQSCEEADGVYPSHTFDGLTDFYLHLQVSKNGWAEGECKGKAGWFPFGYVERRDRVLASKIAEIF
ncbi:hypothetical protein GW17_00017290 [Ensete ventricosum]|nr:hypothetical protein GW17_00017290 [Ensete ventricosum]